MPKHPQKSQNYKTKQKELKSKNGGNFITILESKFL